MLPAKTSINKCGSTVASDKSTKLEPHKAELAAPAKLLKKKVIKSKKIVAKSGLLAKGSNKDKKKMYALVQ